jgi:hypothetical protein
MSASTASKFFNNTNNNNGNNQNNGNQNKKLKTTQNNNNNNDVNIVRSTLVKEQMSTLPIIKPEIFLSDHSLVAVYCFIKNFIG